MAMHFDRWEKDPFFSAAEEVQESADRYLLCKTHFNFIFECHILTRDFRLLKIFVRC